MSSLPYPRFTAVILAFGSALGIIVCLALESWWLLPVAIIGEFVGFLVALQATNAALTEVKKPEDPPEDVPRGLGPLGTPHPDDDRPVAPRED